MKKMSLLFILFSLVAFSPLQPAMAGNDAGKAKRGGTAKVWRKDPFMPPVSSRIDKTVRLSAILYSSKRSSAFIDGEKVQVGDTTASGYKVLDIKRTSVILKYGNQRHELNIGR